jgi:hypothetical protein
MKGEKVSAKTASEKEMLKHALAFKEFVHSFSPLKDFYGAVEEKVSLEFIEPGMFGTVDAWTYLDGALCVFDFKYGRGIIVQAENNTQLQYYALGLAKKLIGDGLETKTVTLAIFQPRAADAESPSSSVTYSADMLDVWAEKFKEAVIRTQIESDVLVSGEHCRYCAGRIICPELKSANMLAAKAEFSDSSLVLPEPSQMKLDQIGEVLTRAKLVQAWIESVEQYAFELLNKGEAVTGWKLVDKRAIRKWSDETEVEVESLAKYGIDAFDLTLKSPAQLEKIAGKDWVNARAQSVSSGVTLVPESDKRQATNNLRLNAKNDFSEMPT